MPGATHHRDQIATHRHLRQTQPTPFANRLLEIDLHWLSMLFGAGGRSSIG